MSRSVSAVKALLRQQVGKDAAAILRKVEKMLKQGVDRAKIEKALAKELSLHRRKQARQLEDIVWIFPW